MKKSFHTETILPPPVGALLLYAADGISVENSTLTRKGYPKTPERSLWVPEFRNLLRTGAGMRRLRELTRVGMAAWRCSPDAMTGLDAAFRDITLRTMIVAALDNLVETSREIFPNDAAPAGNLVSSPPPPPPRPERPRSTPASLPRNAPHRPSSSATRRPPGPI